MKKILLSLVALFTTFASQPVQAQGLLPETDSSQKIQVGYSEFVGSDGVWVNTRTYLDPEMVAREGSVIVYSVEYVSRNSDGHVWNHGRTIDAVDCNNRSTVRYLYRYYIKDKGELVNETVDYSNERRLKEVVPDSNLEDLVNIACSIG